ncbi:MAG: asparagine synthase (glutamine-hydrolyzing) [Planctomycetota bacterium]
MCGIAGIALSSTDRNAGKRRLEAMLDAIVHRGPDDSGLLVDGEVAIGMRRLSIIDLADGQQPIYDESGRYGVLFNGEIYNYVELRKDLEARGHQFKTNSDTEVIVHLYEDFGSECVEHLRGMFGFAIWDRIERWLFIARDRLGIKPLYYTVVDGNLYFGSEIKSLSTLDDVERAVDPQALSEYLSLKYVPAPRTLFRGISCLEPGHHLTYEHGRIHIEQYWDLSFEKPAEALSEADAVERLGELLRESVRLRLRSDVPFGAFLSGGLDSSIIVALMAEQLSQPVKTFSVGFSEAEGADELPYAKQVADAFGAEHHTLSIGASDFLQHAEDVLWHLDQPIADQATVATHMVAKLARQHVKMVLTGEGGDELFAGYARYEGERLSPWTRCLPPPVASIMNRAGQQLPGMRRAKIALNALAIRDEARRFSNWFPMFTDDAKANLVEPPLGAMRPAADVFDRYLTQTDATRPLDRMLYCDSKAWLVDYLLLRGDKLTMANSLEARVPLLDHRLVEFAGGLPDRLKLRKGQRKYLLKRFGEQVLPHDIVHREKQGFPIPIDRWLRNEASEMMQDLLAADSIRQRGFFKIDSVQQLKQRHLSGYADHSVELWGLMSLEMWMRRFIDQKPAVAASTDRELQLAGAER